MTAAHAPRWDGQRLLFSLSTEDGGTARCSISRLALVALNRGKWMPGPELLRRFVELRPRIEDVARRKLGARSGPMPGLLHIWEDDVLDPGPDAAPMACAIKAHGD